jgi:exodeoxyribonuclease-3
MGKMKIFSWNVNGINARIKQGAFDVFYDLLPDVICCQETKIKELPTVIDGYYHYHVSSVKNRFCGNLIMSLEEPKDVLYGMGVPEFDQEARVLTADFDDFYLVNTYAPNTVDRIERSIFRVEWGDAYREFVAGLMQKKPVILCGDFNVSLSRLDYYMDNIRKIKLEEEGFESDERTSIEELLELGLNDAYRYLYPESVSFTHWPNKNRINDKNKNKGARLDYFFMEDGIMPWICDVIHHPEITGSDHCPIELDLEVKHEITK